MKDTSSLRKLIVSQKLGSFSLPRQFKIFPNLEKPADWLKERFDAIKSTVPSFMRPKYFAQVINEAYMAARQRAISQMSSFVTEGHDFTQSLALCAVQMNGMVKSASLWPDKDSASMAPGLPFFSASCTAANISSQLLALKFACRLSSGATRWAACADWFYMASLLWSAG